MYVYVHTYIHMYIHFWHRHVLLTSNTYTVGAVETITISIYDDNISQLIVDAELSYTKCKCEMSGICSKEIFSKDSGIFMNGKILV